MNTERINDIVNNVIEKANNMRYEVASNYIESMITYYDNHMDSVSLNSVGLLPEESREIAKRLENYKYGEFISRKEKEAREEKNKINDEKAKTFLTAVKEGIKGKGNNFDDVISYLQSLQRSIYGQTLNEDFPDLPELPTSKYGEVVGEINAMIKNLEESKELLSSKTESKKDSKHDDEIAKNDEATKDETKDEDKSETKDNVPEESPKEDSLKTDNADKTNGRMKVTGSRVCNWLNKHKRQIIIGIALAAIAATVFTLAAGVIPTLMATNSVNWWIAKEVGNIGLMNALHANNVALGNIIGATYAAKTGVWTFVAGAILGKGALVSAVSAAAGVSAYSIANAVHNKITLNKDATLQDSSSEDKTSFQGLRGFGSKVKGFISGLKRNKDDYYYDDEEDYEEDYEEERDEDRSKTSDGGPDLLVDTDKPYPPKTPLTEKDPHWDDLMKSGGHGAHIDVSEEETKEEVSDTVEEALKTEPLKNVYNGRGTNDPYTELASSAQEDLEELDKKMGRGK